MDHVPVSGISGPEPSRHVEVKVVEVVVDVVVVVVEVVLLVVERSVVLVVVVGFGFGGLVGLELHRPRPLPPRFDLAPRTARTLAGVESHWPVLGGPGGVAATSIGTALRSMMASGHVLRDFRSSNMMFSVRCPASRRKTVIGRRACRVPASRWLCPRSMPGPFLTSPREAPA